MKILVIPDIHCRKFWREAVFNNIKNIDKIVFLGDYVDPYPDEEDLDNFVQPLKDVLGLKLNEPEKITLLLGNHDCHYIWNNIIESSRFNFHNAEEYFEIFKDNLNLFKFAYIENDVIFSHAGITIDWAEKVQNIFNIEDSILETGKSIQNWEVKLELDPLKFSLLNYISKYRGGVGSGSCIWADVREHINWFKTTGSVIVPLGDDTCFQIFGHTQLKSPLITEKWACLDCRKTFIIDTETHEIVEC